MPTFLVHTTRVASLLIATFSLIRAAELAGPPKFESYFPVEPEGGRRLNVLWDDRNKEKRPAEEVIKTVREGLRTTTASKSSVITWIGHRFVWDKEPQTTAAVELIYHAAGAKDQEVSDAALYYGLTRIKPKSPEILKFLVEHTMAGEDHHHLDYIWSVNDQSEAALRYVEPYLQSKDEQVLRHARAVQDMIQGKLESTHYLRQLRREKNEREFGNKLPQLRQTLVSGSSSERDAALRLILQEQLALNMDDSYIEAFAAAGKDPKVEVRREVARQVGGRWVWETRPPNEQAVQLLLELSDDQDREVREHLNYYGLSRIKDFHEAAAQRSKEMEEEEGKYRQQQMHEKAIRMIAANKLDEVERGLPELKSILKEAESSNKKGHEQEYAWLANEVAWIEKEVQQKRYGSDLQKRIDGMASGAVVELTEGTLKGPILISKPLTLRGAGMEKTTIEAQANVPAILIKDTGNVRLEKMKVRWSPASTEIKGAQGEAAVSVRDGTATLEQVALEPIDRPELTPYGLFATGRTYVTFNGGRSKGFGYALMFIDGANGQVTDSNLEGAGHSVVTLHPYSRVEIARNVLARCGFHAVRNTGGVMDMHDNIVMDCAKAGAYLGNKDAHGKIYNNLFTGNNGEIWGYYGSDVAIEYNLFYRSKAPAIIFWNTCNLQASNNSLVGCPGGLRQYVKDENVSKVGIAEKGNHYWQNGEDLQPGYLPGTEKKQDARFALTKSTESFSGDPKFRNPAHGDFTPMEGSALMRDEKIVAGLSEPKAIHELALRVGLKFEVRVNP